MRVVEITDYMLRMFPGKSRKQLRFIIHGIIRPINRKMRRAYILDFTVPKLGRFKTHGTRVKGNKRNRIKSDRLTKRRMAKVKALKKENVLF